MLQDINFKPGDTVAVHQKITEAGKTRVQIFKGIVLGIRGRSENKMFTVQKMVGQISVERIWPVFSPNIAKVVNLGSPRKRVRRAKLTYLKVPKK